MSLKKLKNLRLAVVGATGLVGRTLLQLLHERDVLKHHVFAIASAKSRHTAVSYGDHDELNLYHLEKFDFSKVDVAFFAVDNAVSEKYIPLATQKGALVIDKSSVYRLDPDVPLVIPEINPKSLEKADLKRIISNPNCSTIQLLLALKPIHDLNPIKRVVVSTYQSVSGAGLLAMDCLTSETKSVFMNQSSHEGSVFKKPIAFNVIPQIEAITDNGYTKEEIKMIEETKKILDVEIEMDVTCVRVPVFIGHGLSVHVACERLVQLNAIRTAFKKHLSLVFSNDEDTYYTPLDCAHEDQVYISRLRRDLFDDHRLSMWVTCDNTRKGAALNGIDILEEICKNHPQLI